MEIKFRSIEDMSTPLHDKKEVYETYNFEDGVLLCSESHHYYSDLGHERMEKLINSAKESGWKNSLIQNFADNQFLINIISDETRADWQYYLPLDENSIALDIGAGWGTITMPLARNIKHVVALDGTLDRLKFLSIRAEQEQISNVDIVHADIFKHPFQEHQFDLVSFNGVLEWVGVGTEDPHAKQVKALKIAYQLLKPGGYLYIGIENAMGLKYVMGEPDDHTQIKYISYLEREEASRLSEKHNQSPYTTYTYSKAGYQQMLTQTGFGQIEFYYPKPDYKRIESIHNLNEKNVALYLNEQTRYTTTNDSITERVNDLERLMLEESDVSPFPASYSIFAQKEGGAL